MITLSLILVATLLGSLLLLLAATESLTLLLWSLPAAIAAAAYSLTLAQKRRLARESKSRIEATLINRLSLKRNDLDCQMRWLTQYADTPAMNEDRARTIKQLKREIALLEEELDALNDND